MQVLISLMAVAVLVTLVWGPPFWLLHSIDANSAGRTGASRDDYLGHRHARMDERLNGFEGGSYEPMYDDHDGGGE